FDFLEGPIRSAPGSTPGEPRLTPSVATLQRWRKEVPPSFDFCVVAGASLARLKPGPEFEHEFALNQRAIEVLQARCFLVRTPLEVTPASVWRDRMAR